VVITKHGNSMSNIEMRCDSKIKPDAIIDCNLMKGFIDLCDRLVSHNTCLLKSVKLDRYIYIMIS